MESKEWGESMDEEVRQVNQGEQQIEPAAGQEMQPEPAAQQAMQPIQNEEENPAAEAGAPPVQAEVPPGQGEDPEEEQEEQEAPEENQPEQGENQQNAARNEELAGDDINQELAAVAAEAGLQNAAPEEEGGDPDRAFDTLDDLKKLDAEKGKADGGGNDNDTNERAINDRKAIMQLRKGNLYKAVIYAKMLQDGQKPAAEAKALDARRPGASGSRFDRFLNSSKLDKAGKTLKTANAASGLMAMADEGYKKTRANGLIGKANDILILINSIRGIIKKLRTFKQNSTSPRKKAFAVIGLVADFGMAISKGASLAQGFANRRGWGQLAGLLGHISSFAGMVGQVSALTSVCNTLSELAARHKTIKTAQKAEEGTVSEILKKYQMDGGEAAQENAQQGNAKKRRRLSKTKIPKEKVMSLLERPDVDAEEKAVLATYLARERMISKSNLALANVSTGLITATLGLGATFSKTKATYGSADERPQAIAHAARFGAMTNVSMLLSTVGMHIAKKQVNNTDAKETNLIKEGLWGAVHDLTDEKFGLRKIAATLAVTNPDKGHMQEAEYAAKRYETASKQLAGAGINFAGLFAANDIDTFKNSLVTAL